jgi:transcriptional regulator GlxA family with amidase domain
MYLVRFASREPTVEEIECASTREARGIRVVVESPMPRECVTATGVRKDLIFPIHRQCQSDPSLRFRRNEFVIFREMHLQRTVDVRDFAQELLRSCAVKGDRGVHPRARRGEKREQAAQTESHHAYPARSSDEPACGVNSRFDVAYTGIDVEAFVQDKSFFPVRLRTNGQVHVWFVAPEQLRADCEESRSCKFVAGATEVGVDAEDLMKNHDRRCCCCCRTRQVGIEVALCRVNAKTACRIVVPSPRGHLPLSLSAPEPQYRGRPPRTGWTKVTKNGLQVTGRAPVEIAIVCYPGAQETCIFGLTDLFMYADYFARMHAACSPPLTPHPAGAGEQVYLRTTHWYQNPYGSDLECNVGKLRAGGDAPALVIVPAYKLGPPERDHSPVTTSWLVRRHAEGSIIAAVCGGVFVLADSGLLDGRRATTHWAFAAELHRRYPDLRVEPDRLVIDDLDIVTAGGVLAWADMGLTLVERLLGRAVMCSTARFMLMDPPGREQRLYGDFAPPLRHGDDSIVSIQHWLQSNTPATFTVAALAARASLGTRTFLRRFVKATGMRPSEYQQRLRIARSRELLECTRQTVDQVAVAAGYEDTRGFRRTFKRVIGLSPAEYRRRFQAPAGSPG